MTNSRNAPGRRHNAWPQFNRRTLLRQLAGGAAVAPFLPIFDAKGQDGRPLRLVLWFTPHGTIRENWRPTGGEQDFQLGPILGSLERHRERLLVLDGLRLIDAGSGPPHTKGPALLWTGSPLLDDATFSVDNDSEVLKFGWNSEPSVDQFILDRIGHETPYRSLEFGLRTGGDYPGNRMIYAARQAPLTPETNPWDAFARLMGNAALDQDEQMRLNANRRSVLDLVGAELSQIKSKVGQADRERLEAHLEAVRAIESRLALQSPACAPLDLGETMDAEAAQNTPEVYDRMIEILTASLSCDLTRVASMQFRIGDNDGGYSYDWLGISDHEHHLLSHAGDEDLEARDSLTKIYTWYAERFASFLDRLEAVQDVDGHSLLDNTLVVWGSEIGKGNTHSFENVPFILAGGAAGRLKMGRSLSFDGVEHNRLLTSICHAMGLEEIESFGSTDTGRGGLPGLT